VFSLRRRRTKVSVLRSVRFDFRHHHAWFAVRRTSVGLGVNVAFVGGSFWSLRSRDYPKKTVKRMLALCEWFAQIGLYFVRRFPMADRRRIVGRDRSHGQPRVNPKGRLSWSRLGCFACGWAACGIGLGRERARRLPWTSLAGCIGRSSV